MNKKNILFNRNYSKEEIRMKIVFDTNQKFDNYETFDIERMQLLKDIAKRGGKWSPVFNNRIGQRRRDIRKIRSQD
jgi:hypothetical protein